ncbi:MAG: site-2 protease family protein [Candidatus Jordarchaeaceae archaeon]
MVTVNGEEFPLSMEELRKIVQTEFIVSDYCTDVAGTPVFFLPSNQETKIPFQRLLERLKPYNLFAILRYTSQLREHEPASSSKKENEQTLVLKILTKMEDGEQRRPVWNLVSLIATICTVTYAGHFWASDYNYLGLQISLISWPWCGWYTDPLLLTVGYTVTLLSILGAHEMGHYITSKRRRMDVSLPFFIPFPNLFGTLGAVIFQRSPPINRDSLFDLGLMGPLSGFIIALLVTVLSISFTPLIYPTVLYTIYQVEYQINLFILNSLSNLYNNYPGIAFILGQLLVNSGFWPILLISQSPFREPLIMIFLRPLLKPETTYTDFASNPFYMAAWIGFFVTSINLSPAGMLDGGHMSRAILSRRTHYIASIVVIILLAGILIIISRFYTFLAITFAILVLLTLRREGHPGALDEVSPLKKSRKIIFIVMMFILIISFPPLIWNQL